MQKGFNKFCASFLSLALLVTTIAIPVFALDINPDTISAQDLIQKAKTSEFKGSEKILINTINNEMDILKDKCIETEKISIDHIDASGDPIYTYKTYLGEDVYLNVDTSSVDRITLNFKEGNFNDTVTFMNDKRVFLNGYEVIFESSGVQPRAGFYSMLQTGVPNGTLSWQYTGASSLYDQCASVAFREYIIEVGVAALGVVLSTYINDAVGLVGEFLAGQLLSYLRANDPTAMAISYKDYRKALQPQDSIEPKYQHRVFFYSRENYGGIESLAYTYYEIRVPT